jgi:predicted dehydrogenase
MPHPNRRDILKAATAATVAAATPSHRAADAPAPAAATPPSAGERVVLAVMGMGRGLDVATTFAALPNCFVKYACDVDDARAAAGVKVLEKVAANHNNTPAPTPLRDFHKALDDKEITAMVVATPDHWHAPAAILAAAAGKHVYVEKPCCHNPL